MIKLRSTIEEELWNAIKNSYENEQYTDSIKNAVIYLSDCIRDKSGLESDGVNLVTQAFSIKNPKIKVNKLQTKSDNSIQDGVLQFLSGIYKFIRNPRNHEKYDDTIDDANAIIITINYIIKIIKKSQAHFEINYFIRNRIFDDNFVNSDRYVELLVEEIPSNKKYLLLNELIFNCSFCNKKTNAKNIIHRIIKNLSVDEITDFNEKISNELNTSNNVNTIKNIIETVPKTIIDNLDEKAKYRSQNTIINDIKHPTTTGLLGSCIKYYDHNFILKKELFNTVCDLIDNELYHKKSYLLNNILPHLPKIDDINKYPNFVNIIDSQLRQKNDSYYNLINIWIKSYKDFKNPFENLIENYGITNNDTLPF